MQEFLDDPQNAEAAGAIQEDFQRINDICQEGMGILVRTCRKFDIDIAPDESAAHLSMRLFLDHAEAFEFAWSRYLLYDCPTKLSIYPLPAKEINITNAKMERFREGVQGWFAGLAKGDQCIVRHFEDQGETVILVRHGSYIRNTPIWEGDQIAVNSFRPALEDILVYDPVTSHLHIKATLAKDRLEYLRLFASCVGENEELAQQAIDDEIFTLVPLQDGTFNFAGGGSVARIELVKVRMKLYGVSDPVIELKAKNVREAFKHDLGSLTLNSGILLLARFRFYLRYPHQRQIKVTFEIEPPT